MLCKTFEEWEVEWDRWLRSKPVCDCCHNHISKEEYYDLDKVVCEYCVEKYKVTDSCEKSGENVYCERCGEAIIEDEYIQREAYEIDGELMCEDCLEEFRTSIE